MKMMALSLFFLRLYKKYEKINTYFELIIALGKPSFKKKKIMENSIIGRGGSAMPNSIILKNTVYFNTRPLFEAKK